VTVAVPGRAKYVIDPRRHLLKVRLSARPAKYCGHFPTLRWFVLNEIPVRHIDVTGWHTLTELGEQLQEGGIRLVITGRHTQIRNYARNAGVPLEGLEPRLFPTIGMASCEFLAENSPAS